MHREPDLGAKRGKRAKNELKAGLFWSDETLLYTARRALLDAVVQTEEPRDSRCQSAATREPKLHNGVNN